MNTLSLYELNSMVREAIESELQHEYWVEAELSECRESRGHCYMELIQKDELNATPIARASAKCWTSKWTVIRPYFERTTGQQLHAGMKVRLKVYAQFHEAYGFSWIVTDIDPTFTLGDMARRRQEIIAQLKQEGVFDLQKELTLPLFCQRIAVISSATAAGYGDFCRQLSESGYAFHVQLFPAVMQGEQVEQSIINALEHIYSLLNSPSTPHNTPFFDCVVIIRGGGATADMSGFDTLALAENVAQFPIPIITGIGHDRDECVLDMVSHTRVKTPTAAAAMLVEQLDQVSMRIDAAESSITQTAKALLTTEKARMATLTARIPTLFSLVKTRQEALIDMTMTRLTTAVNAALTANDHRLQLMQQRLTALDPKLLLKRGYSITTINGKVVRNANELKTGDEITTTLEHGQVTSTVK